tara:strand:+ start:297 stop:563 length:267 start_codon:yes stop_codon:yes gene_type:complete
MSQTMNKSIEKSTQDSISVREITNKVREVFKDVPFTIKSDKKKLKDLENKVNKLIEILKSSYIQIEIDDNVISWTMDLINKKDEIYNL